MSGVALWLAALVLHGFAILMGVSAGLYIQKKDDGAAKSALLLAAVLFVAASLISLAAVTL